MANGYEGSSDSSSSSSSRRRTTSTRRIIPTSSAITTPITARAQRRVVPTTQRPPAPEGFHYMPDGTLMSDAEHARLYSETTQPQVVKSTQHDRKYYNPYERDPINVGSLAANGAGATIKSKVIKSLNLDLSDLPAEGEARKFSILGDKHAEFILEIKNEDNYYYNFTTNLFQAAQSRLEKSILMYSYESFITFPNTLTKDTVNGAVSSGIKVVMDTAVASTMAVGDRVTGNSILDSTIVTVAALDPDGDNANEFSLSTAVVIADDLSLSFSGDKQYDIYLSAKPGTVHQSYKEVRFEDNSLDINSSTGSNSLIMQKVIYQYADLALIIIAYSPNSVTDLIKSSTRVDNTLTIPRKKESTKIPFKISCEVNDATKAYQIKRQPTERDLLALTSLTVDAIPEALPGEDIYPAVSNTDTVDGAITGGSSAIKVVMDTNVADKMAVGDKITAVRGVGTVNSTVGSGNKVVIDEVASEVMSIGDQVTGCKFCDSNVLLVTAIDPDTDNENEFQVGDVPENNFLDDMALRFSPKCNRSLTTVAVLNPDTDNVKEFSMSQNVGLLDGVMLSFSNQKNLQWSVDNIDKLEKGMVIQAGTNVTADSVTDNYEDSITIFEGTEEEEKIINNKRDFKDTKGNVPTITKGVIATQAGNIVFNKQQSLLFGGTTQTLLAYGAKNILSSYDYDIRITDLKVSLNTIKTTTSGITNGVTVPVTSVVGILPNVSKISGIGINPSKADPTVTARSATSGGGNLTISTAQTLESGITFTFPGAGQKAIITGNIEILKAGTASQNIYIDVENLLSIT